MRQVLICKSVGFALCMGWERGGGRWGEGEGGQESK